MFTKKVTQGIGQPKNVDSKSTKPRKPRVLREINSDLQVKLDARMKTMPIRFRKLFTKTVTGEASTKRSIRAFCQSCVGYEELPTSVRDCTAIVCPLYMHRPYQEKK